MCTPYFAPTEPHYIPTGVGGPLAPRARDGWLPRPKHAALPKVSWPRWNTPGTWDTVSLRRLASLSGRFIAATCDSSIEWGSHEYFAALWALNRAVSSARLAAVIEQSPHYHEYATVGTPEARCEVERAAGALWLASRALDEAQLESLEGVIVRRAGNAIAFLCASVCAPAPGLDESKYGPYAGFSPVWDVIEAAEVGSIEAVNQLRSVHDEDERVESAGDAVCEAYEWLDQVHAQAGVQY